MCSAYPHVDVCVCEHLQLCGACLNGHQHRKLGCTIILYPDITIKTYLDKRYYLNIPSYILYVLINYFDDQNNAINIISHYKIINNNSYHNAIITE